MKQHIVRLSIQRAGSFRNDFQIKEYKTATLLFLVSNFFNIYIVMLKPLL